MGPAKNNTAYSKLTAGCEKCAFQGAFIIGKARIIFFFDMQTDIFSLLIRINITHIILLALQQTLQKTESQESSIIPC